MNLERNINSFYNDNYDRVGAMVVNDKDYAIMKQKLSSKALTYEVLITLNNNTNYEGITDKVKAYFGKKAATTLTIKSSMFDDAIRQNGFMFFLYSFLSMMFLIGSAAVLYFKTITSIEDDRDRCIQLQKIGMTGDEIMKLSMKELAAVFLVPAILGIFCTGYCLSTVYKLMSDGEYMWKDSLFVFGVYMVIQIGFYILTFNKYKK